MDRSHGLSFPIYLDHGAVANPGLADALDSSISIILGWPIGTRHFSYDFGSAIYAMVGAPSAPSAKTAIQIYTQLALEKWEPRLDIQAVNIIFEEEFTFISLDGKFTDVDAIYNLEIIA